MEAVQLVERHQVEHPLHVFHAEEVAAHVEHHAAPREPRTVADADGRDLEAARQRGAVLDARRHQLAERLDAVEQPRGRGGHHLDAAGGGLQVVALGPEVGPLGERQRHGAIVGIGAVGRDAGRIGHLAPRRADQRIQHRSDAGHLDVGRVEPDRRRARHLERCPAQERHLGRERDQRGLRAEGKGQQEADGETKRAHDEQSGGGERG